VLFDVLLHVSDPIISALRRLLEVAEALDDDANAAPAMGPNPYCDLDAFREQVYEPLRARTDGLPINAPDCSAIELADEDAPVLFSIIDRLSRSWSNGTPWRALDEQERRVSEHVRVSLFG
jgi:hypothetical protein